MLELRAREIGESNKDLLLPMHVIAMLKAASKALLLPGNISFLESLQ